MVRKRNAAKEPKLRKNGKKKWSWKKKTLIIGTPFFLLIAFVGVFFLYQMSRSYEEPVYDLPLAGLKSDLLPKPETGVPADYTPEENAAIAEYVLMNTEHYQSTMDAQVTASVGFINYDQQVRNTKFVNGDSIFAQALSLSSMVKVGEQKYFNNGIYLLRQATDVQSVDNCTWSDDISAMSAETYANRYGRTPDGLSNYLITKDTIVKGEYRGMEDGLYVYHYELDPKESAALYWHQIKTLSGSDKTPLFHTVELTLYLDEEWRPQKTEIHENYDVSMPVIGMANCDGQMVEIFHDYDVPTPLPEQERFQHYIDTEYDPEHLDSFDEGDGDTDIMGYISQIFPSDENGISTLALDFTINDGVPQRAYVQIDTKNMAFKFKWDSLLIGYENERIYLKFGNIKYYLEQEDLMEVLQEITSQIGVEMPSMDELMSEDTMNQFMENMQMLESDGKTNVVIKMDGIELLASLTSDLQFLEAHATIDLDGFNMKLSASQAPTQNIEGFDDSYQDIRSVLKFSEPIINLINARTYAFTFRVDMEGENTLHQNVSARVSRHNTELSSCLIDANINGKWLHVRIVGTTTYLSYGDLKFTFDTRDIGEIIEEVGKVIPADELDLSVILPQAYIDLFTNLDLNAIANSIQSMEMSGDNLALKMKVGDDLIQAQVGRVGGQLSGAHLSGLTVLDSKLELNAKMTAISNYPGTLPVNPNGYTDLKGIAGFIGPVMDLVNANTYEFGVNFKMEGDVDVDHLARVKLVRGDNDVSAQVTTELFDRTLDLRLVDGVTYVQYGNIKLKLALDDIDELTKAIMDILPEDAKNLDLTKILPQSYLDVAERDLFEWLDSIDSVEITDKMAALTIRIGDDKIKLSVLRDDKAIVGAKVEGATILNSKTALTVSVLGISQEKTPIPVEDPQSYADLKYLAGFIGPVQPLLDARTYELDLSAKLEGKLNWAQDAKLYLVRTDDGVNLELSANVSGVPVTVRLIGPTAYVECGNVKLKLDTNDLDEISKQIQEALPDDALDVDLSELLPKAYVKLIEKPTIPALIDCVQGLSLDRDSMTLTLKIGEDIIPVRVTKQGNTLQGVSVSGLTVLDSKVQAEVRLSGLSAEPRAITVNDAEYSDIKEITVFVPEIMELIDANSFGFAADIRLTEPVSLSTTLHGKLVRTKDDEIALDLTAQLEGEEFMLRFVNGSVYAKYGNLKLTLDTRDLDEIMEELKEILPEEWLDVNWKEWIPKEYLDLIENPDIPAMIQNIQTLRAKDGKLTFGIRVADTLATLEATRGQNGKPLDAAVTFEQAKTVSGAVKTEDGVVQGVSAMPSGYRFHLYLTDYAKQKWNIQKPSGDYLDVKELVQFVKPVVNMIQADTYECDLELTLFNKDNDETLRVPAHLVLERTEDGGICLNLTADVLGQDLEINLIDSTVYASYAGLDVKVKTKDFKKLGRQIDSLLPKGWSLDLGDILPKAYQRLLKNPSPLAILKTLHTLDVEDNTLVLKLKVGSDVIQFRAATDGETITYLEAGGVTALGQTVFLTMRDLVLGDTPMNWDVDEDAYQEVSELLDFVKPVLQLIDAKSWKFTVQIELNGETYALDVQLALGKKDQLDFSITSEDLGGVPLVVEHTAEVTYIHYANIELYLKDADLDTVLKKLEEILPEGIDLSGVLDFGDSFDLETLDIAGLLGSVNELSFDGDTLFLSIELGDDTIDLTVVNGEKYPESITVSGLLGGDFGLELNDLEVNGKVSISMPNLDTAVNVVDLIDCLEPTLNILRAKDCTMELTVLGEYKIEIRKVGDKIYLKYLDNEALALVLDVNQSTVLTDLIEKIMDLVDAIEEFGDDPDASVTEGEDHGKLDTDMMLEVLQSLTLTMTGENELEISLEADGKPIVITAGTVEGEPKHAHLLVVGDGETYAELTVNKITVPAGGNVSGRPNDEDYVAVDKIAQFIQPITNLLQAKAYEFDVTADLGAEIEDQMKDFWNGKLHVALSRDTDDTVSARVTADLFSDSSYKKKLTLTYVDDTVAVQFGNEVMVKLNASDEGALIQEIKNLMEKENGGELDLDYSAFLPQSYVDLIQTFTPADGQTLSEKVIVQEVLKRISHLHVQNDTIFVDFAMNAEDKTDVVNAAVSIDAKAKQFTRISLDGVQLRLDENKDFNTAGVQIDVTRISQEPMNITIEEGFADLDLLAGLIQPIYELFQADSYHFDVAVDMKTDSDTDFIAKDVWDGNIDVKLAYRLDADGNRLQKPVTVTETDENGNEVTTTKEADVLDAQISATIADQLLTVTYADDVVYLEYGSLKAKLNVAESTKDGLIQAIQEVVESESGTEVAEAIPYEKFIPQDYVTFIREMYPDLPEDMNGLKDLFNADSKHDIEILKMVGTLLERFQGLHISENTAAIEFRIGTDTLKAEVALDADLGVNISGLQLLQYTKEDDAIAYHNATLNLTVRNDDQVIDAPNADDTTYFDLDTLAEFVQPVKDLLEARSYEFTVDLDFGQKKPGKLNIDQQATVKIARRVDADGNILQKDGADVVDVQVSVGNFLGSPLTLTYWNGDDGKTVEVYVRYGDILKLYFTQDNLEQLLDELPKFLADLTGKDETANTKAASGDNGDDITENEIKEILLQLLPQDYQEFIQEGFTVTNLFKLMQNLTLHSANSNEFDVSLKISDNETIKATITKTKETDGDRLSGLSVSGVTVLDSDAAIALGNVKVSNDPSGLQKDIADTLQGFTDIFGGMTGKDDKEGMVMKALTDQLKQHPLAITFRVSETENGTQTTHEAEAFVDQTTAYAKYKSNKGVNWMKAKVDYDSITELLPSGLYLLGINLDDYPALLSLAQSFGIDPNQQIKSDVLASLFGGIFEGMGEVDVEPEDGFAFTDAIEKITWINNNIEIELNSKVLYGENAVQENLKIKATKDTNNVMTIDLANLHGSDTKTINLQIVLKPGTKPSDAGSYMDFSSINQFYADLANTASFGEYRLKGDIKLTLNMKEIPVASVALQNVNLSIPADIKIILDENNNLKQIYGTLDVDYNVTMKIFGVGAKIFEEPSRQTEEKQLSQGTSVLTLGEPITSTNDKTGILASGTRTVTETRRQIERRTDIYARDSFEFDTVEIVYDASPEKNSGLDKNTMYLRRRFKVFREEQNRTMVRTVKSKTRTRTDTKKWWSWTEGRWSANWPDDWTRDMSGYSTDVSSWSQESATNWSAQRLLTDASGNPVYAYEYVELNFDDMQKANDPTLFVMNYVYYALPFSRSFTFIHLDLQNTINEQIGQPDKKGVEAAVIENILKSFGLNGSKYSLDINPIHLIGDARFRDSLTIALTRSKILQGKNGAELQKSAGENASYVLTQFDLHANVVPMGSGYLVDMGWSPVLANYNGTTLTGLKNKEGLLSEVPKNIAELGNKGTVS